MRVVLLAMVLLVVACAPAAAPNTPPVPVLEPYSTMTASVPTGSPSGIVVLGNTPAVTSTPTRYIIKQGDTLSQIAERFRISVEELLSANPGVSPNALSIGESLEIPGRSETLTSDLTPTAVPFPIEHVACYPIADGGLWCFALVHNDSTGFLEDVTAAITLVEPSGNPFATRTALLPLDILSPGGRLPLSAFFPPEIPADILPHVEVLTALQPPSVEGRYLPASIGRSLTEVSWSGLSANLTGEVLLPEDAADARSVWIAAVAYDGSGNVVGFRRWESPGPMAAGSSLPFSFMVASVAGRIERVEFAVEARP